MSFSPEIDAERGGGRITQKFCIDYEAPMRNIWQIKMARSGQVTGIAFELAPYSEHSYTSTD